MTNIEPTNDAKQSSQDRWELDKLSIALLENAGEVKKLIESFHTNRTAAKGLAVEVLEHISHSSSLVRARGFDEKLEELKHHVQGARAAITNLIGIEPSIVGQLAKDGSLSFMPGEQSFMRMIESACDAYVAMKRIDSDLGVLDGSILPSSGHEKRFDLDRGYGNWFIGQILAAYIGRIELAPAAPWEAGQTRNRKN